MTLLLFATLAQLRVAARASALSLSAKAWSEDSLEGLSDEENNRLWVEEAQRREAWESSGEPGQPAERSSKRRARD